MKKVWNSIFQTVSESVKTLSKGVSKKACHDVVLMTTGISVVTMLTFSVGDLNGNGGSAMVAFAETPAQTTEVQAEAELEAADLEQLLIGAEHIEVEKANLEFGVVDVAQMGLPLLGEPEAAADEEHTEEAETKPAVMPAETAVQAVAEPEEKNLSDEDAADVSDDTTEEAEEAKETGRGAVVLSGDEYQVLLRIVQAEAGTCDEMGKLLVANVILNRMESDEFPDTVSGVVYQKRQFSPVMNGTINTCKITMETRSAVNRALSGEDHSEGALYFMNRSKSAGRNVRWFDANLDYLFKHGDHEFFK